MKPNHDIRIKLTREEMEALDKLYKDIFPELKKSFFYKQLVLTGYETILLKLTELDSEQVRQLLVKRIKR